MAVLRYILLAAAITLTLTLLAHLVLPARGPIPRRTGRRGGLGIAALTAVYAVAAFFSLGSARDPQQFCSFEAGESAVLALERESEIAAVWYYPGLSTGEYTLAYSTDGVTFTPAGTMPQGYANLFKWLQPEMADTAPAAAAYVRITASAHMELGELALYDPQGSRIGVRAITGPAGADALSLINTLLGMRIDIEKRRPILSNVMGGLSGPAVFPVAVRMVYQVRRAVSVPILGMGGIRTGRDIVEMLLAGADAVAMGTVMFNDPTAPVKALRELEEWMDAHGVKSVSELSGAVEVG